MINYSIAVDIVIFDHERSKSCLNIYVWTGRRPEQNILNHISGKIHGLERDVAHEYR